MMMDGMYGLNSAAEYSDKALMSPDNLILPSDYQTLLSSSSSSGAFASFRDHHHHRIPIFGSEELLSAAASAISEASEIQREELDMSTIIKAKIASHPCYPRLLQAYIDCQKVCVCENTLLLFFFGLSRCKTKAAILVFYS